MIEPSLKQGIVSIPDLYWSGSRPAGARAYLLESFAATEKRIERVRRAVGFSTCGSTGEPLRGVAALENVLDVFSKELGVMVRKRRLEMLDNGAACQRIPNKIAVKRVVI